MCTCVWIISASACLAPCPSQVLYHQSFGGLAAEACTVCNTHSVFAGWPRSIGIFVCWLVQPTMVHPSHPKSHVAYIVICIYIVRYDERRMYMINCCVCHLGNRVPLISACVIAHSGRFCLRAWCRGSNSEECGRIAPYAITGLRCTIYLHSIYTHITRKPACMLYAKAWVHAYYIHVVWKCVFAGQPDWRSITGMVKKRWTQDGACKWNQLAHNSKQYSYIYIYIFGHSDVT